MRTLKTFGQALDYVQALPWGTAAGTSRDARMILKYAQAGAKIVTHGSNTKLPRAGDPRNFYYDPETAWSINALRIPNRSLEKYIPELKTLKKEVNACGSELWVSFSAGDKFIPEEYEAANRVLFAEEAADVTDNNASCPNLEVDGKLKQSVCFDPVAYEEYAAACRAGAGTNKISFKWAPVTDSGLQEKLIEKGKPYKPDYIDIANTVAGGYLELRGGKPAIPGVRGGLAGSIMIPIISGMILGMKPMLKETGTKLLATGGVRSGEIAYGYLKLGADGFRFNTELYRRDGDPEVITEIGEGLAHHLLNMGF
ncbi:MAG: hypothetical protein AAB734_00070 [Patescibacteria group bacterium]